MVFLYKNKGACAPTSLRTRGPLSCLELASLQRPLPDSFANILCVLRVLPGNTWRRTVTSTHLAWLAARS